MTDIRRHFAFLLLAAACMAGCGTASTGKESWAYVGKDPVLRSPPTGRVGDSSDAVWRREAEERMALWQRIRQEATDRAKEACARETGESLTPNIWTGYGAAFMTCMKARDWICCFSDPL